jgi:hypothetical protein
MRESLANISPPLLIYFGMGLVVARILLDQTNPRSFRWLQWLQFLVDVLRIVLLWPLVLFIEKLEKWLKPTNQDEVSHDN